MAHESRTNEIPKYTPTPEQLDQIFDSTARQQQERVEAERRKQEFPQDVERVLQWLVTRSIAHAEALAAVEAHLADLETKLRSGAT